MRAFGSRWAFAVGVFLSGCIEIGVAGRARAPESPSPTVAVVVQGDGAGSGDVGASGGAAAAPVDASGGAPEDTRVGGTSDVVSGPATPPVVTPAASTDVIALALGENHTCSLTAGGEVRCWGYNTEGQLGVGSTQSPGDGLVTGIGDASDGPVRAIAAGGYQTCALTAAGRVWCWGSNRAGQVGSGEATEAAVRWPTLVRGVDGVAALALGDALSCAITTGGALYCWGDNSQGQIDDSGRPNRPSATRVAGIERADRVAVGNYHLCVLRGGRVSCRGELGRVAREVAALDEVSAISAGWGHSCAVRRGIPHCWGKSYMGVLGRGRTCPPGTSSNCDADVLYPPTAVPSVTGAAEIEGHDYHTCVRLASGSVTCWGNNQGHAFARDLPAEPWQTAHAVDAFDGVDRVFVGGAHVCALRAGVASCVGNDWAGAVRGAPAR